MKKLFTQKTVFFLLFVIILLAFFQVLSTPFSFVQEANYLAVPYGVKGFLKAGIFSGIYIVGLIAVVLVFFIKNKTIATFMIIFIAIAYGGDFFIQLIGSNNTGISQSGFTLAITEASRAGDMWLFRTEIFQSLVAVILFILFILVIRIFILRNFRINTLFSLLFFITASSLTWFSSYTVFSIVKQSFPAPIKLLAISADYLLEEEPPKRVLLESIKPVKSAKYKTIIWIIDESIGGQYLSLNGFKDKQTTPYLEGINQSEDFKNFGIVPSISNCSGPSNYLLRIGLTHKLSQDFKKNLHELPTIFQYAQRAGFKTYLIDSQIAEGSLQNHLTSNDLLDIDNYVTLSREFLPNMRDKEALRIMDAALNEDAQQPRFIIIVKWGAHWPYAQGYPKEKSLFKPASSDFYTEMNAENKESVMNSYFNVLKFTVDDYLKELLDKRDLREQIIFYTSDHGQNLYQENGVTLTHCHQTSANQEPIMDGFRVPLMVFTEGAKDLFVGMSKDEAAQEQVYPTILGMMGYDKKLVQKYGPTLFEKPEARKVREIFSTKRYLDYTP